MVVRHTSPGAPLLLTHNLHCSVINAGDGLARFGINSTLGVAGLFDVADSLFGMKQHNDDFGLTLYFLRQPFAECDFMLQRVEIHTLTYVPVANCFHIFLGILWVYSLLLLNGRVRPWCSWRGFCGARR